MAALDTVRVSQKARDHLIVLKRRTGIENWNTLCRWALCVSLAESTPPPKADIITDSPIEMTWKTFGGQYHEVYRALLKERIKRDGLDVTPETLEEQFKLHLHRGIGYLFGEKDMNSISALIERTTS